VARQVNYYHIVANLKGWAKEFVVRMDSKIESLKVFKEKIRNKLQLF
jgi:hypothetical protein